MPIIVFEIGLESKDGFCFTLATWTEKTNWLTLTSYEVWRKGMESENLFTKTEMNNEGKVNLFQNSQLHWTHVFQWVFCWSEHLENSSFDTAWSCVQMFWMSSVSSNLPFLERRESLRVQKALHLHNLVFHIKFMIKKWFEISDQNVSRIDFVWFDVLFL